MKCNVIHGLNFGSRECFVCAATIINSPGLTIFGMENLNLNQKKHIVFLDWKSCRVAEKFKLTAAINYWRALGRTVSESLYNEGVPVSSFVVIVNPSPSLELNSSIF